MKILLRIVMVLVAVIIAFVLFVQLTYKRTFDAPFPEVNISTDSAVLAHGEYLIYGPAHCASCHVPKDQFEAVERGEKIPLQGGFSISFPLGTFYAKNITMDKETGIGNLSHGEIARTLRSNVNSKGEAIIPFMPFTYMSKYDLDAIISYLDAQEGVQHEVPDTKYSLLGKFIKRFMLKPLEQDQEILDYVEPDTTAAYGEYLANSVANCFGCHTEIDTKSGQYVGKPFAGGSQFPSEMNDKNLYVTPNLTPDAETGIMADWTKEQFVERMRSGRVYPDSPMPWGPFSRMTENDIKAIYAYLQTVPAVNNKIESVLITQD